MAEQGHREIALLAQQGAESGGGPAGGNVGFSDAVCRQIGLWQVDAVAVAVIAGNILPEVGQLESSAGGIGEALPFRVIVAEQVEEQMPDGVGGVPAVMQHIVQGGKASAALVNAVGVDQPVEGRAGDAEGGDGMLHGNADRVPGRRRAGAVDGVQFRFPPVQHCQAALRQGWASDSVRRRPVFVAQVVHRPAPGIDGVDMGQFGFGGDAAADGEVLVMAARHPGAVGVGVRRGDGIRQGNLLRDAGGGVGSGRGGGHRGVRGG